MTSNVQPATDEEWKILTPDNQTIGELMAQQADNVKKIIADQNQQQTSTVEYPVATKAEPNYSEEAKKQIEKLSMEQLKIKCQHFSKLFQVNKTNESNKPSIHQTQNTSPRSNNHKPYSFQARPVYIQPKTTFKPKYVPTQKPNGFYITQGSVTQQPKVNTPTAPVKYIRLEPVILQKTILNDGRTVYYWHRSLPTAVEISSGTSQNNQISTSTQQTPVSYNNYYGQPPMYNIPHVYGNMPYRYATWPQNPYVSNNYIPAYQTVSTSTENTSQEEQKLSETTMSPTTSTTEQTSHGYGFGSFLPFYNYRQDLTTTTTEPTTTTTTAEPTTEKLKIADLMYAQQLKFIIPVPYEDLNSGSSVSVPNPWDFNQYAYFPKELQPRILNVEMPYNPTFHMIRAVAVPSSGGKMTDEINS